MHFDDVERLVENASSKEGLQCHLKSKISTRSTGIVSNGKHTSIIFAIKSLILFTSSFMAIICCLISCKDAQKEGDARQQWMYLLVYIFSNIHALLVTNLNPANV